MHRERKLQALRRALKDHGYLKGNEATFNCQNPSGCKGEHHKRKLAVNVESDVFHCWVCGWSGRSLLPILKALGPADADYVDYAAEKEKPKDEVKKVYEKVRLPSEFRPLCCPSESLQFRQAIAYLTQRGIHSDSILTYKLGYCETGRYADRIIIPSFDKYGELNFFVGRTIWHREGDLPYLSGKFDKDIIFNELLVDWSRPVTLVEGPFDAIKAGTNAIPIQGKFPSRKLVDRLIAAKVPVFIALDTDALGDSLRIAEGLMKYGVDVNMVFLPKGVKDPGDLEMGSFKTLLTKPLHSIIDIARIRAWHSGSLEHR